uniref:Putative ovule protein n=1 Tax=Solanum chacoense TaxID=4108 RepID=A0A0V0GV74_SOLCH
MHFLYQFYSIKVFLLFELLVNRMIISPSVMHTDIFRPYDCYSIACSLSYDCYSIACSLYTQY